MTLFEIFTVNPQAVAIRGNLYVFTTIPRLGGSLPRIVICELDTDAGGFIDYRLSVAELLATDWEQGKAGLNV